MKKAARQCKTRDLTGEVKQVLTNEWQTSLAVSLQLVFPPDAIARRIANSHDGMWRGNPNMSERTARSHIASRFLENIVRTGFAEKRKASGNRNEYRLTQPKSEQD